MRRTDLPVLFWTKVNRPGPGSCWEWLGAKNYSGTGVMSVWFEDEQRWRMKTAAAIAIYLTYGFWPKLRLRRKCDSTSCCNPNHFRLD